MTAIADLEVDVAGLSAELLIELTSAVREQREELARLLKMQTDYERKGPVFVPLQGTVAVDSNQDPGFVDLGGPAQGRMWLVRQMVIGGSLWSTTAGGTGLVLVQANSPTPGQVPNVANVQDAFGTMPAVHFYSSSQFRIRHPQRIYVAIVVGTASTVYTVAGDAYDAPDVPLAGYAAE
jgi:hypothetical protein